MSATQGYQSTFQFTSPATDAVGKRRRGAAPRSCAECRRLKLRCTRVFPCVSCVKRGCGAICPEGSLTTGQGNRFVLASTEELHEKIQVLSYRVRELEDGLRESHAKHAQDCHPLLEENLLAVKAPLQRPPRRGSDGEDSSDLSTLDWSDFAEGDGSHSSSGFYPHGSHSPLSQSGLLTPPHPTSADGPSSAPGRMHGSTPSPLPMGGQGLPGSSSGRYQPYGVRKAHQHPPLLRSQSNPGRCMLFEQDPTIFPPTYSSPLPTQLTFLDDGPKYGGCDPGNSGMTRLSRQAASYGSDVWDLPHDVLY